MDYTGTLHTLSLHPPGKPDGLAPHPVSQFRKLSLTNSSLGDTLIYLDSPLTPLQPIRVPSATLLSSGSSILTQYLTSPTYQHRILRRKKLLKNGLPLGVRFVIDLSPPVEGEDAVEVTERLWCPDNVRRWKTNPLMRPARYQEVDVGKDNQDAMMGLPKPTLENELSEFFESTWGKKSVKRAPIGGENGGSSMHYEPEQEVVSKDAAMTEMPLQPSPPSIPYDNCVIKGSVFACDTTTQKTGMAEVEAEISDSGDCNDGLFEVQLKREVKEEQDATTTMKSTVDSDELRLPPAYSSARHIAALERVIGVLMGIDPHIFSATMWYTVYKVAETLDLGSKVCGDTFLRQYLVHPSGRVTICYYIPLLLRLKCNL